MGLLGSSESSSPQYLSKTSKFLDKIGKELLKDPNARAAILDYLKVPIPLTAAEEQGYATATRDATGAYDQTRSLIQDLLGYSREAAQTGFLTDIAPLVEKAKSDFNQDLVPGLAEQYAFNTGIGSSDFFGNLLREGRRLETDIGQFAYNAQEAAAGRRMQAIPMAGAIGATNVALPFSYANDLMGLGGSYRSAQESVRPGARMFQGGLQINNALTNAQYSQPGYNPTSGTAGIISALAGVAGGMGGMGG